jgi:hypothetical protein
VKPDTKPIRAGSHCRETLPRTLPRRVLVPGPSRGNITAERHRPQSWKKHRKTTAAMPPVNEPYKSSHPSKMPLYVFYHFPEEK